MNNWPTQLKKTSARIKVLQAFKISVKPLSVSQLQTLCPAIPVATLYRVVETFLNTELIELSDDFQPKEKQYILKANHRHHIVKCIICLGRFTLKECPIQLSESIEGFIVLHHHLQIEGICSACQKTLHPIP